METLHVHLIPSNDNCNQASQTVVRADRSAAVIIDNEEVRKEL